MCINMCVCVRERDVCVCVYVNLHNVICFFGKGNGTPLQYSCLENPMDEGAW